MRREWECKKCGTSQDPEYETFSWWQCTNCKALRWPNLLWVGGGIGAALLVLVVWVVIPDGNNGPKPPGDCDQSFMESVQDVLANTVTREGEITSEEMQSLTTIAGQCRFSEEKTKKLVLQSKTAYIEDKRRLLIQNPPGENEITPAELGELCEVADAMESRATIKECTLSYEEIIADLREGEFAKVERLLPNMPDTPEKMRIQATMSSPLDIKVELQYQKETQEPSPLHPLGAPELEGITLNHRDNYRLFISVSAYETFLYIFQQDSYGQITRIFPDPVWSQVDNPIQAGVTYRIPPGDKEWLYLDALSPRQETAIQEVLYIIAAPWQAGDVERLYGEVYRVTSHETRQTLIEKLLDRFRLRADDTIKSLYYKEFSFKHEG